MTAIFGADRLGRKGATRGASGARAPERRGADSVTGMARGLVEAALLGAVAFGCAQAGWAIVAPPTADAVSASGGPQTLESSSDPLSPFAIGEASSAVTSEAARAAINGMRLMGVRVSADPARSSAIIVGADGRQSALRLGETWGEGLTLTAVEASHIVVAVGDASVTLDLAPTLPALSLALAGAPRPVQPVPIASDAVAMTASPTSETIAWLTRFSAAQIAVGARVWTLPGDTPAGLTNLGLRAGDEIAAINGMAPSEAIGALANLRVGDRIAVLVRRGETVTQIEIPTGPE